MMVAPFAVAVMLAVSPAAAARTFFCDGGDASCLIQAIQDANAAGRFNTIVLSAGTYTLTSPFPESGNVGTGTSLPAITSTLTIRGEGADHTVIERSASADSFRLIMVTTGNLTLDGLTLRGGGGPAATDGGAILALGPLRLKNAILTGNSAREGGAIEIRKKATISNSSIVGNTASVEAGGIFVAGTEAVLDLEDSLIASNSALFGGGIEVAVGGFVTVTNCTFTGNTANVGSAISEGVPPDSPFPPDEFPPGAAIIQSSTIATNNSRPIPFRGRPIDSRGHTIKIRDTILANNLPTETGDCPIAATSLGFNLVRNPNATFTFGVPVTTDCSAFLTSSDVVADPLLGPFVDEGTPGHGFFPLTPASPAIDAGGEAPRRHSDGEHSWKPPSHVKAGCPATDQIGQPRTDRCDIGAIEFLPDRVVVRLAQFDSETHVLFVTATSSAARDHVDLAVSVTGCFQDEPMLQVGPAYLFLREVNACGSLDRQAATVTSSRGGSASAEIH